MRWAKISGPAEKRESRKMRPDISLFVLFGAGLSRTEECIVSICKLHISHRSLVSDGLCKI